jgi:D-aspartate ligase
MSYTGKHILILDGYSRQSLPYMRAFRELGCETTIYCHSRLDCGYVSRLPNHRIVGTCSVEEEEKTEQEITELIRTGKYDLVLPIIETTVTFLARNKQKLSQYAYIAASDEEALKIAQDKYKVMAICAENGIPCAKTLFNANNIDDVLNSGMPFPIIIKPRSSYGAMGFKIFHNEEEFRTFVAEKNIDLREMVVQECIPEDSLVMSDNIFVDKNGDIKSSFLYGCKRVFPVHGGTGCLDVTFNRPEIHANCAKLVTIIGLRGCVGVDLMIDSRDNVAKVIEINPRILAGAKVGFLAGVNQAQQLLEDAFCQTVTPMMEYKSDIRIRMSQIDVLWFIKSPNRFNSDPSWFSNKNTKDQMFSWDDPLPWFTFLFQGMFKLKKKLKDRNQ